MIMTLYPNKQQSENIQDSTPLENVEIFRTSIINSKEIDDETKEEIKKKLDNIMEILYISYMKSKSPDIEVLE